jgi:ribonuclease P protein component
LYASGRRADGEFIRCVYLLEEAAPGELRAGFAIPRRTCNAVRRNRLRRRMREAFRPERERLRSAVRVAGCSAFVLFVFKGKRDVPVERIPFPPIQRDIANFCSLLVSRLEARSCT